MLADQSIALSEQRIIRALQRSSEDRKPPGFCALLLQAIQGLVNMSLPDIKLMAILHSLPENTHVMLIDLSAGNRLRGCIPHGLKPEAVLVSLRVRQERTKRLIQHCIEDPLNLSQAVIIPDTGTGLFQGGYKLCRQLFAGHLCDSCDVLMIRVLRERLRRVKNKKRTRNSSYTDVAVSARKILALDLEVFTLLSRILYP